MNCPKCERPTPSHRRQCLYCGATLPARDNGIADSGPASEAERQARQAMLDALPPELRRDVQAALEEDRQALVASTPDHTVTRQTGDIADDGPKHGSTGIDEMLKACEIARKQFDMDVFDYDEYRRMVLDAMKGYMDQMDDKTKLNYALHGIKDSAAGDYLDDEMLKALQHHAVAAAAGPILHQPVKRKRRFDFGKLWRKK